MRSLKKISEWLYQISRGWVALAALALFLLFSALVLPRQAAQAETYAGEAGSPDSSFFYAPGDLYRMAEAYGEAGRRAYVRARFTFDVIWPLVYLAFLSTTISWVYGKAFAPGSPWRRANLFPLAGALFDFLENLSASIVMMRYPVHTPVAGTLAPIFTTLKWFFVIGSFALLLAGLAAALWRRMRRANKVP